MKCHYNRVQRIAAVFALLFLPLSLRAADEKESATETAPALEKETSSSQNERKTTPKTEPEPDLGKELELLMGQVETRVKSAWQQLEVKVGEEQRKLRQELQNLRKKMEREQQEKEAAKLPGGKAEASDPTEEIIAALVTVGRTDKDPEVRSEAIASLSRLNDDRVIPPLAQLVREDSDEAVRSKALEVIASRRNKASTRALLELYDQIEPVPLKKIILGNLYESRPTKPPGRTSLMVPEEAVPKLVEISKNSPDSGLRMLAVHQLGNAARKTQSSESGTTTPEAKE